MTREEAEKKLLAMDCITRVTVWEPHHDVPPMLDMMTDDATASNLRAIADILDQVGKEDGKAGEG